MTDGIETGKQEGFKLNEAGVAYFGEDLTPVFEELMNEYGAENEKALLSEPRLSVDLARRTKDGIAKLTEFLVNKVVGRTVLFTVNDRGEKRPRKVYGDPIKELAVLNGEIFIGNFPVYANPSINTPEGIFLNRLLKAVKGAVVACFIVMAGIYKSKLNDFSSKEKKLSKDDSEAIAFYQTIGFNFDETVRLIQSLGKEFPAMTAFLEIAFTLHGTREFIWGHKLTVPRKIDTERLRGINGRIFEVISKFRDPGMPLVINPKQEGKILEGTVSEISPLRTDGHAFGEALAQVIFFDEAYAKTGRIENLAAANLRPVQEGSQSLATVALPGHGRGVVPGSMQFLVDRFDGEISPFGADHRGLKILLGDSLYEIVRNAVLVELAQILCRRDVLQKHLGDLLSFDPARQQSLQKPTYRKRRGVPSKEKTPLRDFPRIYRAMIDNAEPSEPSGVERCPISPHARLLPAFRYPSRQAVISAQNAGEIVKQISDEITDREDVRIRLKQAVSFGYAVSWYEHSDKPEYAGRLLRRDVRSDEIERMAKDRGVSVNEIIDKLIAGHKGQNAALRFYTYVSREDPATLDAIRGRTEVQAADVIARASDDGPDRKSS